MTLPVTVADGVARLTEGGAIAGSTLTQDAALRLVVAGGLPLADAVAALTSVPARAIGLAGRYGSLRHGAAADAVLLDDALQVAGVWVDGALLYDMNDPKRRPVSDFELGQPGMGDVK